MDNNRYVLLLDILGFKGLVERGDVAAARRAVEIALDEADQWASGKGTSVDFDTLYFSDTIIVYAREPGACKTWYDDLVYIGGRIVTRLLADGFPVRGALSFGDFTVAQHGRHPVYVGGALIDAHLGEGKFGLLGFVVLASALDVAFPSRPVQFSDGFRKRGEGILGPEGLLVNWLTQFHGRDQCENRSDLESYVGGDSGAEVSLNPWIPIELAAFRYVARRASAHMAEGDFAGRIAGKYHATYLFLRYVLGESLFQVLNESISAGPSPGPRCGDK